MPMTDDQLGTVIRRIFSEEGFAEKMNADPVGTLKGVGYAVTPAEAQQLQKITAEPELSIPPRYYTKIATGVVNIAVT
jgi:hypothetical protein